eukprot:Awhi_evm2s1526
MICCVVITQKIWLPERFQERLPSWMGGTAREATTITFRSNTNICHATTNNINNNINNDNSKTGSSSNNNNSKNNGNIDNNNFHCFGISLKKSSIESIQDDNSLNDSISDDLSNYNGSKKNLKSSALTEDINVELQICKGDDETEKKLNCISQEMMNGNSTHEVK